MADGLLSNILNFIDQRKQATMAGLGLLASNPQEYLTGRAEQLRDFTRAQEAGLPAERAQLRGLLATPEQIAAKQYADQQLQDLALGFAGTVGAAPRKLPLPDMGEITKFTKPLPAGQLYRETSPNNLMDLFKGNTPFGSPITYFSEVPEMALGQGANKGVMIKVNSEGLKGRPYLGKPGLEQAYLQKAGEFEIKEQPNNIIKAINEVWVSPAAYKDLRKAEVVMFNRQLSDLEKSGVKVNKVDKLPNVLEQEKPVVQQQGGLLGTEAAQDLSYRGSHTPPNAKTYGATLDDLGKIMPVDVYSSKGTRLYGLGNPEVDSQWFSAAYKAKGKPDADVTVYRAVPKGVKNINSGDWVTTSKKYAQDHGESALNGEYEIVSKKVKAKTLSSEGYPYEFGYNE